MAPDPKPPRRVRDPDVMARLHREWRECVLCGETRGRLSLHHVSKHPRDDVRANLVMLCGSGTTGCHGDIEANVRSSRETLGEYLLAHRRDTIGYLSTKLGPGMDAWFLRQFGVCP